MRRGQAGGLLIVAHTVFYVLIAFGFFCVGLYCSYLSRDNVWLYKNGHILLYVSLSMGAAGVVGAALLRTLKSGPTAPLAILAAILIGVSYVLPGFVESPIRSRVVLARENLRKVGNEIQKFFGEEEEFPSDLGALGMAEEIVDPFSSDTGAPFKWLVVEDRKGVLLSVGPDRIDEYVEAEIFLAYSPTNGTLSRGDLLETVEIPAD